MTAVRRVLGSGPQEPLAAPATTSPHRKGAHEADLDAGLPTVQLPDLGDLRNRGVLGAPGRREQ
ncbi:hypothetical protein ACWGK6_24555 [Streptomyces violaceusniger]|uniref:hypothetical protein n=1 Tax=Streptomyces antimycoticus TaxID=68175 RepID=UPI0011817241|nr:hypothetical protein [Streptomyces antimycoticus]